MKVTRVDHPAPIVPPPPPDPPTFDITGLSRDTVEVLIAIVGVTNTTEIEEKPAIYDLFQGMLDILGYEWSHQSKYNCFYADGGVVPGINVKPRPEDQRR